MGELDLPDSFEDWPADDQLGYLQRIPNKLAVVRAVIELVDADVRYAGASSGMRQEQWAKLLVATREAVADE